MALRWSRLSATKSEMMLSSTMLVMGSGLEDREELRQVEQPEDPHDVGLDPFDR